MFFHTPENLLLYNAETVKTCDFFIFIFMRVHTYALLSGNNYAITHNGYMCQILQRSEKKIHNRIIIYAQSQYANNGNKVCFTKITS